MTRDDFSYGDHVRHEDGRNGFVVTPMSDYGKQYITVIWEGREYDRKAEISKVELTESYWDKVKSIAEENWK